MTDLAPPVELPSDQIPSEEERKWATYAHHSVSWMTLVYFWFGSLVATTMLLEMYRSKSRYVALHARQSLYLQIVISVLLGPTVVTSRFIELSSLNKGDLIHRVILVLLLGLAIAGFLVYLASMVGALAAVGRMRKGRISSIG